MVAIIIYFDSESSLMSLLLLVTVLMQQESVFFTIKHIALLAVVICVSVLLSVATATVWVDVGQANANFLFFEGLCLWVMLAVGLIEFCSVLTRKSK